MQKPVFVMDARTIGSLLAVTGPGLGPEGQQPQLRKKLKKSQITPWWLNVQLRSNALAWGELFPSLFRDTFSS